MAPPAVLDKKTVPTKGGCNIRNVQYKSKCRRAIKRESDFYGRLQLHATFFIVFFFNSQKTRCNYYSKTKACS